MKPMVNIREKHQQRDTEKEKSLRQYKIKRQASFFHQSILFDLNLRISATPRAHRTSDQTDRVLEHTAPIVLSPPYKIPPLPL